MKTPDRTVLPAFAMHARYGPLLRAFFARYFNPIRFPPEAAERIRQLSASGPVVYLARSANLLHFLYLNHVCLQEDLPLARFVNEVDPLWLQPVSLLLDRMRTLGDEARADLEDEGEHLSKRQLATALGAGEAALLFLDRPTTITSPGGPGSDDLLQTLIQVQQEQERPIHLVPHLIMWTRHPEREDRGIADAVFGLPEAPGLLRSLYLLWRRYRTAFVKVAEPVNLKEFIQQHLDRGPVDLARALHETLESRFSLEVYDVTGPRIRPHPEFMREILADPKISEAIETESGGDAGRREALRKHAHDVLDEIAAEPRIRWPLSLNAVLNVFWNRMYEGMVVDEAGFEKIRAALRKSPVVLCPSHKSHVDYLILSQLCLRYAVPLPHIAAGVNLSFWPMGPIFRHSGAFFMRRSFKGDALYPLIFRTYLRYVMGEGFPIEFFIEGTRSRTGKLLSPKFGILSWLVHASLEGTGNDIAFVPISVDYEKIVESRSYVNELSGGEKEKENVTALVKSGKALRSRYGKIYVQVAEPISLRGYLRDLGFDENSLTEEQRRRLVTEIGHEILFSIARVSTVTPAGLLAFCLLTHRRRGMSEKKMLQMAQWAASWIRRRTDARFSHTLADFNRALADSAARFSRDGLIAIQDTGFELVYSPVERKRLALDYYRNNLIHHFVPAGIVALALESFTVGAVPRPALEERLHELSALLKFEFLFRSRRHFEEETQRALADLASEGVIREEEGFVVKVAEAEERRQLFRSVLEHFVEAYWLTAKGLRHLLSGPVGEKEFISRTLKLGDHLFVQGEISLPEALSREVLKNALQSFSDRGVVESTAGEGRRGPLLALTADWKDEARLDALAIEIQKFLRL